MFSKKVIHPILFYWIPFLCYSVIVVYLSHQSNPARGFRVPVNDKVIHFFEYVCLQFLAARTFCYGRTGADWKKWFKISLAYCLIFAGLDEVHQAFIPARICSFFDCMADMLGVVFCAILILKASRVNNKIQGAVTHETI